MPKKTRDPHRGLMSDREKKFLIENREEFLKGNMKKTRGHISDREMTIFLANSLPKKTNKPKWKDRSAYRAK